MRIAMWSGPRNLSTAMMYSFGARDDCAVWDEPFYAAYLAKTGLAHPLRAEILAAGETDADKVAARCVGAVPENRPVFYQKHMTQHMLDEFDRAWLKKITSVFLIRHPAKVMASYLSKRESSTLNDIGFWQQEKIFRQVREITGQTPVVVDSETILENPEGALKSLCSAIGLPFQKQMLVWSKGPHPDDGVWAPHWYKAVWESTRFSPNPISKPSDIGLNQEILRKAMANYTYLKKYCI